MARKGKLVYAFLLLSFYCRICDGQTTVDCNAADGVGSWMGDGSCDPQNLSSECDWDGGDCCKCTCEDEKFVCGTNGYLCLDPTPIDDDMSTCEEESLPACLAEDQIPSVVENTMEAQALAERVNCSGGNFEVKWRGNILVNTEIVVSYGTVLNINGVGPGAIVDGAGKTRLFGVVNAFLQLSDVEIRNGNATFGGAIAVTGSTLTLNRTSFIGNTATDKNGGAMFLYGSSAVFNGYTEFLNNSAKYGGAIHVVSNSSASWKDVTNFTGNSASHSGGALSVMVDSTVVWEKETTFEENFATSYRGGALFLEGGSSASWRANATFVANHALYEGGAIFIDIESNASWSAGAEFFNNSVTFAGGGAILIAESSKVQFSGETIFRFNSGTSDGGAISSRESDSSISTSSGNQESFLWMNDTIIFENNICGTNGGGLALLGGLHVLFGSSNATFIGNKAGVAGGGIYISTTGVGPVLSKISFLSNLAYVGGGAFVTGTSTSDSEVSATFDGCTFIGNKAESKGGAIDIASDNAEVINTLFKGNKAREGGALRIVETALVERCSFEENVSDMDGGQAISTIGFPFEMNNCDFSNNLFDCEAGTFLDEIESADRFEAVCLECNDCPTCGIENSGSKPTCSPDLDNSHSPGGTNITLQTLPIHSGYWRATNVSINILECYNKEACKGGLTGSPDYCDDGYKGPSKASVSALGLLLLSLFLFAPHCVDCSVCIDDYTKGAAFTCTKCTENVWGIVVATIFLVVSVVITFFALKYVVSVEMGARRGIIARILRRVPLQSMKIIIVAWQILTQFTTVADITYPGLYQRFLNAVDIINFDLTWMISTSCFVVVDFHSQLLILTIGPIMVMLFLGGTYTYVVRRYRASEEALTIIRHKHVSMILLVMFLVYSSVSSVVFQMFDCEYLDDGKEYLRADYTIECDSPRHQALMIYSGFMILLYPVGIPGFFAYLLFQKRDVLMDKASRDDALSVRPISDLWKPYRPSRFYYEVIECGRRIVLTGVILIVDDDSAAKIAVTLTLAFVFTVVSEGLAPYESQLDAWVSRLGHAVVVSTIYYALLLKVDVSDETHASQSAFGVVLITIHVSMVLVVIGETALTTYSINKRQVEDPLPRLHQYRSPRIYFTTRTMSGLSRVSHESLHRKEVELRAQKPAPLRRNGKLRPL